MENLFNIYHPVNGKINHKCESHVFEYEHVATVEAASLEEAYKKGNNSSNPEYADLGLRSTCVGDIITKSDKTGEVEYYIKDTLNFVEIPSSVVDFINTENKTSEYDNIVHDMLDDPEYYGLI
jgi:hypothetical protein